MRPGIPTVRFCLPTQLLFALACDFLLAGSHHEARWTVAEVQSWLETLRPKFGPKVTRTPTSSTRLDHYKTLFLNNDIDGDALLSLDISLMESIGIQSCGHRLRLTKHISEALSHSQKSSAARVTLEAASVAHSDFPYVQLDRASPSASVMPLQSHDTVGVERTRSGHESQLVASRNSVAAAPSYIASPDEEAGALRQRQTLEMGSSTAPIIEESAIQITRMLGSGCQAQVFAGLYEGTPVAVKKHKSDSGQIDPKAFEELKFEVGKMMAVNHPCTVQCYGMLGPTPGIVLELVDGESLFHVLHGTRFESFENFNARLPWPQRLGYLLDTSCGLRAIHAVGIIHGDVKSLNLLVSRSHRVKVADFGLSKVMGNLSLLPGTKTLTGTPQYLAPEVMRCEAQGLRVDIFALAVVMWECLTGSIPWKDMEMVQIILKVSHENNNFIMPPPGRPHIDDNHRANAPHGLVPLIHQCWAHSPANRPGIVQVCTHLEEIRQRCLEQIHQISNKRLRTSHGRGERFGDVLTGGAVLEHANRQIASVFQSAQMAKNLAFEVISLLRRAEQPEIQMQGALVIAATCGQNEINRREVIQLGGLEVLVNLLKTPYSELLEASVRALASLLTPALNNTVTEPYRQNGKPMVEDGREINTTELMLQLDGVEALQSLLTCRMRSQRIKNVAAEAMAYALANGSIDRWNLPRSGMVELVSLVIQHGTSTSQEIATSVLLNAMRDDATVAEMQSCSEMIFGLLVGQLSTGTQYGRELAAAAIWKASATGLFTHTRTAISGLVGLLRTGDEAAQTQAAGALRSICATDHDNKLELNHEGGLKALVDVIRTHSQAAEQACATIANACAACPENQTAAQNAGVVPTLVSLLKKHLQTSTVSDSASLLLRFTVVSLRNICVDNTNLQEELSSCQGDLALVEVLWISDGSSEMLEVVTSTLYHVSTHSSNARMAIRMAVRNNLGTFTALLQDQFLTQGARTMLLKIAEFVEVPD